MFLLGVAALLAAGAVSATGVVVLREGRLITQGVPRDMLTPDLIAEVFGSGPGLSRIPRWAGCYAFLLESLLAPQMAHDYTRMLLIQAEFAARSSSHNSLSRSDAVGL